MSRLRLRKSSSAGSVLRLDVLPTIGNAGKENKGNASQINTGTMAWEEDRTNTGTVSEGHM